VRCYRCIGKIEHLVCGNDGNILGEVMGKLVASPLANIESLSFDNDLLGGRREFGKRMAGLVKSASTGAVLALDAPWGEGKTTFVRMWQHMLANEKPPITPITCIYLDAFEQDHIDDPFLPLVASIVEFAEKRASINKEYTPLLSAVKKNAGRVGVKFLGLAASIAVRTATLGIINKADITALNDIKDDIAGDSASAVEDLVASQLARFVSDKETLASFRKDLEKLASQVVADTKAPLVFIIDELDRCRPTFAVTLIERIKHVLDVPGIVFLFVLNRKQLEQAVRSVYGARIDAAGYLAKFIHIWCSLPKSVRRRHNSDYQKYCTALYDAHELITWDDESMLRKALPELSQIFGLTLREMERLFTNVAVFYATASQNHLRIPGLAAALAVIRIRRQIVYQKLRERRISYREFVAGVPELQKIPEDDVIVQYLQDWFRYCLMTNEELKELGEDSEVLRFGQTMIKYSIGRDAVLPHLCSLFDMFDVE
jgi:predicted KAP-like P-loop ATPase